ncbi:hypothetical protein Sfulv_21800 [Streptomyces fulvorobeus]|uniref:Uncharacterized protein n=1 Tax=Streptomyces fulvorobeus TaxID=284028 RepID=A0A7J0C4I2_9ACTN|nr:hypothetical protein [Streptomyces fulvorobeus]GFM97369.1 hypothetical protein Sfulv_21800 [Streptomyces fulvorobeus]
MAAARKADVRTLDRLAGRQRGLATHRQLQAAGVARSMIGRRCRPGGPWQRVLPRVTLIQTGAPDPYQRMPAAVLYAAGPGSAPLSGATAVVTGEAALSLYRVRGTGSGTVDVLLHEGRKLRDIAYVRIRRTRRPPPSLLFEGVPCVRRPRAAADFVARETRRRLKLETHGIEVVTVARPWSGTTRTRWWQRSWPSCAWARDEGSHSR